MQSYRRIGFAGPLSTFTFSVSPTGVSLPHRPPETFAAGFILSCAFAPLQSISSYARPASPDAELLPWGFVPLRDIHRRSPLATEIPAPLRSALDVSHVLGGFLLRRLCGFVSPRSHVRDSLSRGFPLRTAVRAFTRRCPRAGWRVAPTGVAAGARVTCPVSRAFIRAEIRRESPVISR